MRLSAAGKKESTVGQVVTLMSVDIQKLMDVPPFAHFVWSAPFIIIVAIVMLWQKIGTVHYFILAFLLKFKKFVILSLSKVYYHNGCRINSSAFKPIQVLKFIVPYMALLFQAQHVWPASD